MLHKKFYSENEWLSFEVENIFKIDWIFVCLKSDLSNNNDFVTLNIFGNSIVIQNFKGVPIAFQNICAHRFKRIQTQESGNRPLLCEYHGWNYDKEGIPRVPKRDTFNQEELACKKLTKYQLEICGEFVFINLEKENKTTLIKYLGEFYSELTELSHHIGKRIDEQKFLQKANWKLLVENVLEGYHCPMIHKESLVKVGYCIDYPKEIKSSQKHNSHHSARIGDYENEFNNKLSFLKERTYKHNSFYHIFIFPNLFLTSVSGSMFYIGRLAPKQVNETELLARYFSPKYNKELTPKEKIIEKALGQLNFEAGIRIIIEDNPMVESCQEGLNEISEQTGILSDTEEVRIIEFHKVLKTIYEND